MRTPPLVLLLCAISGATSGCGETDAPAADSDAAVPSSVADWHELAGFLWQRTRGATEPGRAFCSGTMIGPRAVVAVEHCGRAVFGPDGNLDPDLEVGFGIGPTDDDGRRVRVDRVEVHATTGVGGEGIAIFHLTGELEATAGVDWTKVAVAAPPEPETRLTTHGYGFGCDSVDDPACCDPRYATCDTSPWGRRATDALVVFGHSPSQMFATPVPGDFLCSGDSGVGALGQDAGASRLAVADAFAGTEYATRERLCVAFRWPSEDDPWSARGLYLSQFVSLCPFRDLLAEAVPTLSFTCPAPSSTCVTRDDDVPRGRAVRLLRDTFTELAPDC